MIKPKKVNTSNTFIIQKQNQQSSEQDMDRLKLIETKIIKTKIITEEEKEDIQGSIIMIKPKKVNTSNTFIIQKQNQQSSEQDLDGLKLIETKIILGKKKSKGKKKKILPTPLLSTITINQNNN